MPITQAYTVQVICTFTLHTETGADAFQRIPSIIKMKYPGTTVKAEATVTRDETGEVVIRGRIEDK